jgi:8-oxo-dGTP pyrophosphatase MutT (NUDIX family)
MMGGVDALKAYVYATWKDRLLVFDEPDFPEIGFQIPGGTLDPGETFSDCAAREFVEETGLPCPVLRHLLTDDYGFLRDGQSICHRRSYFHGKLEGNYPESWIHLETSPSGGGDPIRFRFSWMPLAIARIKLGGGFEDHLSLII